MQTSTKVCIVGFFILLLLGIIQLCNTDGEKSSLKQKSLMSRKILGNQRAKKSECKIEIGWMEYDQDNNGYKIVQKWHGGGTRNLNVPN